jgi:transmembrane protein
VQTPAVVARLLDNDVTLFVARIGLVSPYVASGVSKLFDWGAGLAEMSHVGLHPSWVFNLSVLVTELLASTLILANRYVWLGAGALGVFTVLTIFLAHGFWAYSGAERAMEMAKFFEHLTICAAFILITVVDIRKRYAEPGTVTGEEPNR